MCRDLAFDKYEGLGNDFIVVRADSDDGFVGPRTRELCDRHYGIGADGVLLVLPPKSKAHRARMRVLNADGSIPEMCGNGLRCVVRYLASLDGAPENDYMALVETDAGVRTCRQFASGDVEVTMGKVMVSPPFDVHAAGNVFQVTPVDIGNPHAVIFAADGAACARTFGPDIERHPAFPAGANVEFVQVVGPTELDVHVWERGVGITRACGTGACAAAAAAVETARVVRDEPLSVWLPGGRLQVRVEADGVLLRGPARRVFAGVIVLDG